MDTTPPKARRERVPLTAAPLAPLALPPFRPFAPHLQADHKLAQIDQQVIAAAQKQIFDAHVEMQKSLLKGSAAAAAAYGGFNPYAGNAALLGLHAHAAAAASYGLHGYGVHPYAGYGVHPYAGVTPLAAATHHLAFGAGLSGLHAHAAASSAAMLASGL